MRGEKKIKIQGDDSVSFDYNIPYQLQMYFIDEWFPYVGEYNSNDIYEWNELCSCQTFRIGHRRAVFIITYLLSSCRQDVLEYTLQLFFFSFH